MGLVLEHYGPMQIWASTNQYELVQNSTNQYGASTHQREGYYDHCTTTVDQYCTSMGPAEAYMSQCWKSIGPLWEPVRECIGQYRQVLGEYETTMGEYSSKM